MSRADTFWARRKAGVAAEAEAEQAALDAQVEADAQAVLEEKTDAEILEELDLPDPDTLGLGDDFSVFMSKAVPDRLRRRALRTLWRSNPVLANVDMLVDYGEDFTDSATVIENMQTAYQVGKGMLKHVEEMARQAEEKAKAAAMTEEAPTETDEGEAEENEIEEENLLMAEDEANTEPMYDDVAQLDAEEDPLEAFTPPSPRRMTFHVEGSPA